MRLFFKYFSMQQDVLVLGNLLLKSEGLLSSPVYPSCIACATDNVFVFMIMGPSL